MTAGLGGVLGMGRGRGRGMQYVSILCPSKSQTLPVSDQRRGQGKEGGAQRKGWGREGGSAGV